MKHYRDHILGGTRLDLQGERLPREFFDRLCEAYKNRIMVMYPNHDVSQRPVGRVSNLRVVKSEIDPKEWDLIGDVELEDEASEFDFKGFSIGGAISIRKSETQALRLYLPIEGYKDATLVDELLEDGDLSIDRWIKKGEAEAVAIFTTAVVLVLKPAWEDFYESVVSPRLHKFFNDHWPKLKSREISLEYLQAVEINGRDVHLRFTGIRGSEETCFSQQKIQNAIILVRQHLSVEKPEIAQISLVFDSSSGEYFVNWMETRSGEVIHVCA